MILRIVDVVVSWWKRKKKYNSKLKADTSNELKFPHVVLSFDSPIKRQILAANFLLSTIDMQTERNETFYTPKIVNNRKKSKKKTF